MNLTRSFTLRELTKSPNALRLGISNEPGPNYINNLRLLATHVLQPIRDHFNLPVTVLSGYRGAELNRAVGGTSTSQHLWGQAADIEIQGVHNAEVWRWVVNNLEFDQCIAEYLEMDDPAAGWVHVSYKSKGNRGQDLSCVGQHDFRGGLHYVA